MYIAHLIFSKRYGVEENRLTFIFILSVVSVAHIKFTNQLQLNKERQFNTRRTLAFLISHI